MGEISQIWYAQRPFAKTLYKFVYAAADNRSLSHMHPRNKMEALMSYIR